MNLRQTRCPSTFLRAPCEQWAGHAGGHTSRHTSGHVTVWTDAGADQIRITP